jgi:hypothetical protein
MFVNELAAVENAVTQDEKINDGPKNELKIINRIFKKCMNSLLIVVNSINAP